MLRLQSPASPFDIYSVDEAGASAKAVATLHNAVESSCAQCWGIGLGDDVTPPKILLPCSRLSTIPGQARACASFRPERST